MGLRTEKENQTGERERRTGVSEGREVVVGVREDRLEGGDETGEERGGQQVGTWGQVR